MSRFPFPHFLNLAYFVFLASWHYKGKTQEELDLGSGDTQNELDFK